MKRFRSGSFFSGPEGNAPRESRRRVASHRIERSRTTVASVLFALAAILTGLVALGYSACGQDAVSAAEAVDFILTPENGELATGGQISLAVMVGPSETANVDRADVHLNLSRGAVAGRGGRSIGFGEVRRRSFKARYQACQTVLVR